MHFIWSVNHRARGLDSILTVDLLTPPKKKVKRERGTPDARGDQLAAASDVVGEAMDTPPPPPRGIPSETPKAKPKAKSTPSKTPIKVAAKAKGKGKPKAASKAPMKARVKGKAKAKAKAQAKRRPSQKRRRRPCRKRIHTQGCVERIRLGVQARSFRNLGARVTWIRIS